ncbi:MAG: zinc ribbon domain-containing protein [Clostridia bacterium]|nr:zinc ribbon domain-containing protein [Clostridia bacterium]
MARYIKTFQLNCDENILFNQISNYLNSEGYMYTQYNGENVFEKGIGMISGPTYFKFLFEGNTIRLESWMKYAIFPGLYVGELGTTGVVGSASKGAWKKRIAQVEAIILQFGYEVANNVQSNQYSNTINSTVTYQTPTSVNQFCTGCGTELPAGTVFCSNCGQAVSGQNTTQASPVQQQEYPQYNAQVIGQPPQGQFISKKDYINNYIPSFKRDLKNVAIACYICAGLNGIISLILNPLGIIDSLVLLGVTLGMHLGKSKTCAIILLIVACFEALYGIIATGRPTSIIWVIAGVWAVVIFNKAGKEYKNYISRGR